MRRLGVQADYFLLGVSKRIRDGFDLFLIYVNVARLARAAMAAPGARKSETVFIPGIGHGVSLIIRHKSLENYPIIIR
jgi:hypothetical protein